MSKLVDIDTGEAFGLGLMFIFTVLAIHGLFDCFIYPQCRKMAGMPMHGAPGMGSETGGATS